MSNDVSRRLHRKAGSASLKLGLKDIFSVDNKLTALVFKCRRSNFFLHL